MMLSQSTAYTVTISSEIEQQWRISNDVFEGTHRMRKAKETYLPKFEEEDQQAYKQRLKKAVLKNVYKKTLTKAVGNLLKNGVTSNFPNEDNVDGKGTTLKAFAAKCGVRAAQQGIAYVIVDAPQGVDEMSLQLAEMFNVEPYFMIVNNLDVTEIKYTFIGSTVVPILFEYRYILPDAEGDIRKVFELVGDKNGYTFVHWRIEKVVEDDNRQIIEEDYIDIPVLPIVAMYGSDTDDVFVNAPPYLDLAYYNIMHYQATSDAAIAHHVAATPMLLFKGSQATERDAKGNKKTSKVKVSPWQAMSTTDPNADAKWVETSGASLTQHREWLKHIEDDMAELSLNFNLESPDATATANLLQAADNQSGIDFLKNEIERGMYNLITIASLFSSTVSSNPEFEINSIGGDSLTPEQRQAIESLHDKGLISDEQYIEIINKTLPFDIEMDEEPDEKPDGDPVDPNEETNPPEDDSAASYNEEFAQDTDSQ